MRQGCPLSPLLFLLIMEGQSLLINEAKILGKINGISFSTTLVITHLLFVDDVAIFVLGTLEEWACFKGILDILTTASCMVISVDKSSFLYNNISSIVLDSIQVLFPYTGDGLLENLNISLAIGHLYSFL